MKKMLVLLIAFLLLSFSLSACGCKHEVWKDATCDTPKTCAECGETEGEALGHVWRAATCETPKTCETCGVVEGQAKGHAWVDANCEAPKTCANCNKTEGEALGHAWVDATTEAPKTCTTCQKTEGTKIETDPRFTTAATKEVQGTWAVEVSGTGEMMGIPDFQGTLDIRYILELHNDGKMKTYVEIVNEDDFKKAMVAYIAETIYVELEAEGTSRAEADAAFQTLYGMSIQEYAQQSMSALDFGSLFDSVNVGGVYYVADGKLYTAIAWSAEMEAVEYTVSGDTLTLQKDITDTGLEVTVLKRVSNG